MARKSGLVLTNPDFPAIQPRRDASRKLYKELHKMTPKLSNLKIVLGYWNENPDSCFRFNNPKQFSNWIIWCQFIHLIESYKNDECFLMKILKIGVRIVFIIFVSIHSSNSNYANPFASIHKLKFLCNFVVQIYWEKW